MGRDYIFTTTQFLTVELLDRIHGEMGEEENLLICATESIGKMNRVIKFLKEVFSKKFILTLCKLALLISLFVILMLLTP